MPKDQQGMAKRSSAPLAMATGTIREPGRVATWLIETGLALAIRALYRSETFVPGDFALKPGTLIVSNHLRDADVPILGTALCKSIKVLHFAPPLFASREVLLRPHVLSVLTREWQWPRPVSALLGAVPMAWLFRAARARPIRRVREFNLRQAAELLVGAGFAESDWEAVLNARGRRELGAEIAARPLRLIDDERSPALSAHWGLRRLCREARMALAPAFRSAIDRQLHGLARALDGGHCVYLAPEGGESTDGRFGRVREGAWRIFQLAARPPEILPAGISYDPLAPGRLRVIVRIGAPLRDLDASNTRAFAAVLRESILRLVVVNPSHLLAAYIAGGPEFFSARQLAGWIRDARTVAAAAGFIPDTLLADGCLDEQLERRLRWLASRGILARDAPRWRNLWQRDSAAGWDEPANVVRYLANAVADRCPELVRTLARWGS